MKIKSILFMLAILLISRIVYSQDTLVKKTSYNKCSILIPKGYAVDFDFKYGNSKFPNQVKLIKQNLKTEKFDKTSKSPKKYALAKNTTGKSYKVNLEFLYKTSRLKKDSMWVQEPVQVNYDTQKKFYVIKGKELKDKTFAKEILSINIYPVK